MEELILFKKLYEYGLLGGMLGLVMFMFYKYGGKILKSYLDFNKQIFENSLEHTKATSELAKNVSNTGLLLNEKLKDISKKLDDLVTKDLVNQNHSAVMNALDEIRNEFKKLIEKNEKTN